MFLCFRRIDSKILGDFGLFDQSADSLGGELKLHAANVLGLDINRKSATSLDV